MSENNVMTVPSDIEKALKAIIAKSHSHIDGRFYFDDYKGRSTLDIKMRRDGVDTLHEADWLTDLGWAIKEAMVVTVQTKEEADE